jgi:hypothetical protein
VPVIQARTREELRVSIFRNLGSPFVLIEADAAGDNKTFHTDDIPSGGTNEHNGKWLVFTSGTNDGSIRRVTASTIADNRTALSFHPSVAAATANGNTAELVNEAYNPAAIHDFINQAIIDATGAVYDPIENISLHADTTTARFDIPSNISMIRKLLYRSAITSKSVHPMGSLFDETKDSDFTQLLDTEDKKQGGQSLRLTIGGDVSAGDFVTDSITAIDISRYTHLEGWVKATTTLAAGDFVIRLDSGTVQGDSTDLEILSVPATTAADTWTFVRIALATPELDTAIASVGLEYNANQAANTVWFDDFRVVKNNTAIWTEIAQNLWGIDPEARDLILSVDGRNIAGYSLLKILGGDKPALLTADATASEIDDMYIIRYATALALASEAGSDTIDLDARRRRSEFWFALAEQAKASFPILQGVRVVE